MIELIKNAQNRKITDLQKLSDSDKPVIMYGAGSYAVDVAKFLKKHGVSLDACCVDKKYLRDNQLFMNSLPVIAVEDVSKKFRKYNLVIGFANYVEAKKSLTRTNVDTGIYFFDAPHQLEFFDYHYIKKHSVDFQFSYDLLKDQKSKDIFIAFINAKISGDPSGLYTLAEFNQYFNELFDFGDQEVFVDCGAYDGDTVLKFIKSVDGKYSKILAFEPDKSNLYKLRKNIKKAGIHNVELINKGCWSKNTVLRISSDGNMTAISDEGENLISVDSVDNVLGQKKVTLIKMDIEGAELEALKGSRLSIVKYLPKLAICVYHKPEDLIKIPKYIKEISDNYDFYLRHHQYISWETVLYAVPKSLDKGQ